MQIEKSLQRSKTFTKRRKTSQTNSTENDDTRLRKHLTFPATLEYINPLSEVTIHLGGYVEKILHVDINLSIGQIQEMNYLKKRIFLAKNCIPISPTAIIRDVHQIFKNTEGVLHINVV